MGTQIRILKAFMDWYGNDSFYPDVYDELGVSDTISLFLKSLAAKTNARTNHTSLDLDEDHLQILRNSERFLEYKKEQQRQQQQRR
mmetsp:Transcript_6712/g.14626  ORF Transcript_6712/g.14626 Transcript_6712/m.14626 type:complete len:86 (-) Transcript_6712:253-510(-)